MVAYGGFWRRVLASIIDSIILGIAGSILGGVLGAVIGWQMADSGYSIEEITTFSGFTGGLIGIALGWLYSAILESSSLQATVGKMALGVVVTDLNGERISFLRATGRHFAKILSSLIMFIGYIMVGLTERKQGLHDMLASTLVYKTRDPASVRSSASVFE